MINPTLEVDIETVLLDLDKISLPPVANWDPTNSVRHKILDSPYGSFSYKTQTVSETVDVKIIDNETKSNMIPHKDGVTLTDPEQRQEAVTLYNREGNLSSYSCPSIMVLSENT